MNDNVEKKMNHGKMTLLLFIFFLCACSLFAGDVTFFGGKQYFRNKGKPVIETDSFIVPPGYAGGGFTLKVINGDSNGDNRISSGVIELNGQELLGPSDFNRQVGFLERTVSLNTANEISVQLKSSPGSFITINIYKFIPPPVISQFSAAPGTIQFQQSSTLNWVVNQADSVGIDQGIGNVQASGSHAVSPTVPQTTYKLTSTNLGGVSTSQVLVTVLFPVPDAVIAVNPTIIKPGQSTVLTWSTFAAHTVSIGPGIGAVDQNGTLTVTPGQSTIYTLTAVGYGGTKAGTAEIFLDDTPPAIKISEPGTNEYLNSHTILVKGTAQDASPFTLTVNNISVPVVNNTFSVQLQLSEGVNTIAALGTDVVQHQGSDQISITIDSIFPNFGV
ncbi:MAG: hypothetical protein GY940_25380, partial [bacterium]|nr:hypothetical protein [bacterium]